MSNHIHLVLKPLLKGLDSYYTVLEISETLKSVSAHMINKALGIKGKLWQTESYDRVIRDETELLDTLKYVIMNPVAAGLIENWSEWHGTYLSTKFQ